MHAACSDSSASISSACVALKPCLKRSRAVEPDDYCSRCGERIGHQPVLACVCRASAVHMACLASGDTQHLCELCEDMPYTQPCRRTVHIELPREAAGIAPIKRRCWWSAKTRVQLTTVQARRLNEERARRQWIATALQRWLLVIRVRRFAKDVDADKTMLGHCIPLRRKRCIPCGSDDEE